MAHIFTASELVTATTLNQAFADYGVPAGVVAPFAGSTAPSTWLLCDGSTVSRTTYASLFSAIGVTYGSGDGSTTFTLPDLRGRMPVGKGTHADVDALGDSDGLSVGNRRPKHKHSISDNGHTHGYSEDYPNGDHATTVSGSTPALETRQTANRTTDSSTTGITVGPQTGSEPTDSPAYITLNMIIKT